MQLTNRTVSFREGQAVSDHAIFEDADGTEFIAEPGPVQRWLRLSDINKERHDRVQFLIDAEKATGIPTKQAQRIVAYEHLQRVAGPKPLKLVTPEGKLVDNK